MGKSLVDLDNLDVWIDPSFPSSLAASKSSWTACCILRAQQRRYLEHCLESFSMYVQSILKYYTSSWMENFHIFRTILIYLYISSRIQNFCTC